MKNSDETKGCHLGNFWAQARRSQVGTEQTVLMLCSNHAAKYFKTSIVSFEKSLSPCY